MKIGRYKKYIRKVLLISKLVLILVLGYMIVRTLVPGNTEQSSTPASAMGENTVSVNRATGSPEDLSLEDYAEIIEGNPFDFSGQTADSGKWASMAYQRSVPEELGLALSGTISGNPEVARAIIKDVKTGVLDSYKINQIVAGARIESIEEDAVVLVSDGQRAILRLNIADSSSNSTTLQTTDETRKVAKAALSTTKAETNIQTKSGHMEAILNNAVIKPYYTDGRAEGLQITGLENISAAKDIGLKNKDIIRSVNGHILTDKQKAFQVFKKATSQSAIDIELLRDNKTKKLSFPL